MNKGELVDAIAEKVDVTKKEADSILTAILETIVDAVSEGEKVTLVGFGSFEKRHRKAREGRILRLEKHSPLPQPMFLRSVPEKRLKQKLLPSSIHH